MIDIEKIKPDVANLAQKHNLALVILYGSQATESALRKAMLISLFWVK